MSISSQAELLGVDVVELSLETGGKPSSIVDQRLSSEERTLNLRGRLGLPRGLSMSLDGQSSSDLKKYTVVGVGKLLALTKKVVAIKTIRFSAGIQQHHSMRIGLPFFYLGIQPVSGSTIVEDFRTISPTWSSKNALFEGDGTQIKASDIDALLIKLIDRASQENRPQIGPGLKTLLAISKRG